LLLDESRVLMQRVLMVVLLTCLIHLGCEPGSNDEQNRNSLGQSGTDKHTESATGAADADAAAVASNQRDQHDADVQPRPIIASRDPASPSKGVVVDIELDPGDDSSPQKPRYSPKGSKLQLTPAEAELELGVDGLVTELLIGPDTDDRQPIRMLVTRAAPEQPYIHLYVDADRNGRFDEERVAARVSENRGKFWSSFTTSLPVTYPGPAAGTEEYPIAVWLVVDEKNERPEIMRYSRRGFKSGDARVGDELVSVVLSDSDNDGVLGEGDWWELHADEDSSSSTGSRRVGDFHWLGETAYVLEVDDASGRHCRIVSFDPGLTREQDELARDVFAADRMAVKAANSLKFRHDADQALAAAASQQVPCFIKFETPGAGHAA